MGAVGCLVEWDLIGLASVSWNGLLMAMRLIMLFSSAVKRNLLDFIIRIYKRDPNLVKSDSIKLLKASFVERKP